MSGRSGGVGLVIAGSKPPVEKGSLLKKGGKEGGEAGKKEKDGPPTIEAKEEKEKKEGVLPITRGGDPSSLPSSSSTSTLAAALPPTDTSTPSTPPSSSSTSSFREGITVVSAFEGYAFDAGMRVGDSLLAVDDVPVVGRSVDQVRDLLRGPPNTQVKVRSRRREGGREEGVCF